MKHLVVLSFVLFSITALFSPVNAQSAVDACEIELSVPFSTVKGKVVRSGNNLIFIDDDLGRSVSVDRSNIKGLSEQRDVRAIYLRSPIRYRERDHLQFEYRVITPSPNCEAIRSWLTKGVPNGGGNGKSGTTIFDKYQVIELRKLARDHTGTLSISAQTIEFTCNSDRDHSRKWALRDIRRIEQRTPYLLMIYPYAGESYTFEFPGMGLETAKFRSLRTRITNAGGVR